MPQQPLLKSENSFSIYLVMLLLGVMMFLSICYYLTSGALEGAYPDLPGIILGAFFGIIGLGAWMAVYRLDSIYILADHFVVKSIFGNIKKTIYFSDITSWKEVERNSKYGKWRDLTIYTRSSKYKLSSSIYHNYEDLKAALTMGKQEDVSHKNKGQWSENLMNAWVLTIIAALFLWGSYHLYSNRDEEIQVSELQTIYDIVTNKPEIERGSKSSRYIRIKLQTYPEFSFDISGIAYSATYADAYVENVKIGDTLELDIMKDEYLKKLLKEKPLGFWDKAVNYSFIYVLGLRDKKYAYLSLADYNEAEKQDNELGFWIVGIIGMGALVGALYQFLKA